MMMEEQYQETINHTDFLGALIRRRTAIMFIAAGLFVLSALVAFLWPPTYRSTATILIEEQEIPPDLVRSTITTFALQRIQTIAQRVMSSSNLMEIVDKYNLYPDQRKRDTREEILERMRKAIKMDTINADVVDPISGRPMPATIAFTLAYEGDGAEVTQKVANELTTLYLNENLKSRTEKSAETFDFLTDETHKVSEHIAELEKKLADFKEKNVHTLPELSSLNHQLLDRTDLDLRDTVNQIRSLEDRKFYLEGELGQTNPNSPMFSATGERILDPVSRLKVAKTELAAALAQYSEDHPDVVRLRREVAGLEKQLGTVKSNDEQAKQIERVRADLGAAREKYSPDHPDVIRLTKELESLESAAKNKPASDSAIATEKPENPAYINLQAQLQGVNSDLKALNTRRDELRVKMNNLERYLVKAPQVEKDYLSIQRDYENSQLRYKELKAKQMAAQVGQELEKERKGERFTLVDPPQLPEKPVRPNRIAILVLGFILSIGGGVGYAFIAESLDSSMHSARGVLATLGNAPLAVIPYMDNSADVQRAEKTRKLTFRLAIAGIVAVIVLVQFLWIPWDVLWFKSMRVLTNWFGG